jgi:hypothetical protein
LSQEKKQMPQIKVLPLSSLPPGSTAEVTVGEGSYALCNLNGEIHALDEVCPCSGGPLGQGGPQGQSAGVPVAWVQVQLPHFDVNVAKLPVSIVNGDILIDV